MTSETEKLVSVLAAYDPYSTISTVAGLTTFAEYQSNALRLEILVHLAVACCTGKKNPRIYDLKKWLNTHLGNGRIASFEDPPEDVFITNICTPEGNWRIFQGLWNSSDYFLQVALDTLIHREVPPECENLLGPSLALLKLGESIANRLSLPRWHSEPSHPSGNLRIGPRSRIKLHADAVTFNRDDLAGLGIEPQSLSSFVLTNSGRSRLLNQVHGTSTLERQPIIEFENNWVVSIPSAISPAIRLFLLTELKKLGFLREFQKAMRAGQMKQVLDEGLFEIKREVVSMAPPDPKQQPKMDFSGWLLNYETNKYIHVILLQDQLEQAVEGGMNSDMKYSSEQIEELTKYVEHIAGFSQSQPGFSEGFTLFIMGGIGRGYFLPFERRPSRWHYSILDIPDLLLLSGEPHKPLRKFLKCITQRGWAENQGVSFHNMSGDLNFYSFGRDNNYRIVPRQVPVTPATLISVGSDFISSIRSEVRRLLDKHQADLADGQFVSVIRFGHDSYFENLLHRPIYVSLDHLKAGVLAGVVETNRGSTWLLADYDKSVNSLRKTVYEVWSGVLGLFERIVLALEKECSTLSTSTLQVTLNFSDVQMPDRPFSAAFARRDSVSGVKLRIGKDIAKIVLPRDFLVNFQSARNTGERMLVTAIARVIFHLHTGEKADTDDAAVMATLDSVLPDNDLRILHLFHTYSPVEALLSEPSSTITNVTQEDFLFNSLLLSGGCITGDQGTQISGKDNCNEFLHQLVDKLWIDIRKQLQSLDRASTIKTALTVQEDILRDREHWRRTARAVLAIHGEVDDVHRIAEEREKDRTDTAVATRALVEMAICECPTNGGHLLFGWDLDLLLAKISLLLTAATDSDAIFYELIDPTINLHANGEYSLNRQVYEETISQYRANYLKEKFDQAARDYEQLYLTDQSKNKVSAKDIFRSDFITAFQTEFGLTLDEVIDGIGQLMELAIDQNSVVVETTTGELRNLLVDQGSLSLDAAGAFMNMLSLVHRTHWDLPPEGYDEKDIFPWRFRRRLSSVIRPILLFGQEDTDLAYYGLGGLKHALGYLIHRTERGALPSRFFNTNEMKSYLGKVSDERGSEFEEFVSDKFRSRGWETETRVKMSQLGADPELADGDVDVLAWRGRREILIIECKRVQLARTVAEVAEIFRRFKGEAKDDLDKHMKRVRWIQENPSSLKQIVGFVPSRSSFDHMLITSTHVPMRYLKSLPIPANKIGPID